jgi:hypothetical protein
MKGYKSLIKSMEQKVRKKSLGTKNEILKTIETIYLCNP